MDWKNPESEIPLLQVTFQKKLTSWNKVDFLFSGLQMNKNNNNKNNNNNNNHL
jgi:hypothetical protein